MGPIDPALMQILQLLIYALIPLMGAITLYITTRTKQLAEDAKTRATEAVTVAKESKKEATNAIADNQSAIAENTELTKDIKTIVNGQREAQLAEIERLKSLVLKMGGDPN